MSEYLNDKRKQISDIDKEVCSLIAQRMYLSLIVGIEKKRLRTDIIDEMQKEKVKQEYKKFLGDFGVSLYELIHEESVKIQKNTLK